MDNDHPLVSFCITFYNQARYVPAALDGAFAQTYRPLEIVISDDCSTDGTDAAIKSRIDKYRSAGGDVPIIYNRNTVNLGNLGNRLKFGELTHGELLVKADGDDISLPERSARIVEAWLADGKRAKKVSHRAYRIDDKGRSLGLMGGVNKRDNIGSCHAYSRDCWDAFACNTTLHHDAVDDVIFCRRVLMIGHPGEEEIVIPDALIYYRIGSGISTAFCDYRSLEIRTRRVATVSKFNMMRDLADMRDKISETVYAAVEKEVNEEVETSEKYLSLLCGQTIGVRFAAFRAMGKVNSLRTLLLNFLFVLPPAICGAILNPYERLRRFMWLVRNGEMLPLPRWNNCDCHNGNAVIGCSS